MDPSNPFADPSTLPFELPPFADISEEHYLPAFEAGMAEQRAEVNAITGNTEAATVENTLDALERSGALLRRVSAVFYNVLSSASTPGLQQIEAAMAEPLAAHHDAIHLDPRLFARIESLIARDNVDLSEEQRRLLWRYHLDFARAGAGLPLAGQQRLRDINAELSTLTSDFRSRLLDATAQAAVLLQDPDELAGLSPGAISAARAAAEARGLDGHLLALTLFTVHPALASLTNRSVRQRLYEASRDRGLTGGHETLTALTRIVALRAERATLLGYRSHADYVTADQTAGSLAEVDDLLERLITPALRNARQERDTLAELASEDGVDGPLQAWDWAYYSQRAQARAFDVDADLLRDHLVLDNVFEAVLWTASQLYGLTFTHRPDLVGYLPDVQVLEVARDDNPVGLVLVDWFAREGKKGGAWMSTFVDQSRLTGQHPVAVLNLNIVKPADGPVLLTLDEVNTAFHEFGHVLHALLSDVEYPRFSGTSVPRDFVEFPSQVNEMWAWEPDVLSRYARHHLTDEPLDPQVIQKVIESRSAGAGFAAVEYLAATVLDLAWHRLSADEATLDPTDVEAFEQQALGARGFDLPEIAPRYRSSYFAHIFAGGYSAGYYSYIWSEVLDADLVDWFHDNGGLLRSNGERFAAQLLSRGGSVDPMDAFVAVRGRAPDVEPLLRRRRLQ